MTYRSTQTLHATSRKTTWASDVLLLGTFCLVLYFFVSLAHRWTSPLEQDATIELSMSVLPKYAMYSLIRAFVAYGLSLFFTLTVGYAAAKSVVLERILIPLLDVGQSIPVVGFLPGLVLGLIAIFPNNNLGLEMACILSIFTGQVWNMALAYYASLKNLPNNFHELAKVIGFSPARKMYHMEIPYSMTTLAWNSLMSMSGGWFFLIICESFNLGARNYRLPGLGSFMDRAIKEGKTDFMVAGVVAMILVIVLTDFVIWRPILAWSQKFRLEEAQDQTKDIPFVTLIVKDSKLLRWITIHFLNSGRLIRSRVEKIERAPLGPELTSRVQPVISKMQKRFKRLASRVRRFRNENFLMRNIGDSWIYILAFVVLVIGGLQVYELVRPLVWEAWRAILWGGFLTLGRVSITLILSSIWTIPAGIYIGSNQKLVKLFQPFVQIAAAFPAPMLYPLALMALASMGLMNEVPAIVLMMLGVQWYILFNVLAGASTISKELKINLELIGVSKWTMWRKLYLPSVFPALISGWITAAGGAWNASIIVEYVEFGKQTVFVHGLGSLIKQATDAADYHMLAACLFVMCVGVVFLNRLVWGSLYRLSERRFKFEG